MLALVATEAPASVTVLTLDELEDELATLAAHLSAGMGRWLELVGELDRRGSWAASGLGSCAQWLAWRCALAPRAAREHVRVARRLGELPGIHAAFSRGELSYAKVRALTRVADPSSEAELLELAFALTAAQLERAVRAYRRVSTVEAAAVHEREELTCYWDEDGSLVVRGRLAPEDGALLLRALEAARERLRRPEAGGESGSAEPHGRGESGSAEPRALGRPASVDALLAVADAALRQEGARSGGERYQVVVHVDERTLASDEARGGALADGPALAAETVRRLTCDAAIVRVSERRGASLSVGRKTRTIPAAMRRALALRDRRCRFPGCENRRVDAHHVRHWARGGETALANLVLLCRRHHRLVHEGGYRVDERLRFYDPRGHPLAPAPLPARGSSVELLERNRGLSMAARTCRCGDGDPLDLGLAVAALCQRIAGLEIESCVPT